MLKFVKKHGGMIAALAMVVTALSVNSACHFFYNQPKLPESAKKLRKF